MPAFLYTLTSLQSISNARLVTTAYCKHKYFFYFDYIFSIKLYIYIYIYKNYNPRENIKFNTTTTKAAEKTYEVLGTVLPSTNPQETEEGGGGGAALFALECVWTSLFLYVEGDWFQ